MRQADAFRMNSPQNALTSDFLQNTFGSGHMLREIDLFLDVDGMREALRHFHSHMGRPSIDPELIIRMMVIGYVMGIRSERRLYDEVHLNFACRWLCRLGLEGKVPDYHASL